MAEDKRSAKKRRFTSNHVTLKVGGNGGDTLTAHETLLQDNSPFFAAALEKKWKEGQSRHIELPEDATEVVAAYVDYLYTKALEVDKLDDGSTDHPLLARLYCFGEKVQDDRFCNTLISGWCAGINQKTNLNRYMYPGAHSINILYGGTPAGSPARRFVTEIWAQRSNKGWNSTPADMAEFCKEALADIASEVIRIRSQTGSGEIVASQTWMKKF